MALSLCVAGAAHGARIDYWTDWTFLHSDNINLSEDDPVSVDVIVPRLAFDATAEGSRLAVHARGQFEYRDYQGGQFSNEFRNDFAGQLNWTMVPERLNFVAEDYLSNDPLTLGQGDSPGNQQSVNVFLAGPTLLAHFNDATRGQLDLRAAETYAETSKGFDSRRYSAAGKLLRDLTPTQQLSLNGSDTRVRFDNPDLSTDYDRSEAFIAYRRRFASGDATLDGGYTWVRPDAGQNESAPLLRLEVNVQSGHNRWRLRARRQLSDAVQDLIVRNVDLEDPIIPELAESAVLVTRQLYRQRLLDLDYRYAGERWSLRLLPQYRQFRYLDSIADDRDEHAAFVDVGYRLTPRSRLALQGLLRNRHYLDTLNDDRDRVYGVQYSYQLTRHWSWEAGAYRNQRDSDRIGTSYRENAYRLTVTWHR